MKRTRILGLVLVAMFATSALAASTASAKRTWWVANKELAAGEANGKKLTVALNAGTLAELETKIGGVAVTIKCEKLDLKEGLIYNAEPEAGKKTARDKGIAEFSKCKSSSFCVVSEPIRVPPKAATGESVIVENTAKTKFYEDNLPEENAAKESIFAEFTCGATKIIVKTKLKRGAPGAANEGEGGDLAEIVNPEACAVEKEFVFVNEPKKVLDWKGAEVAVNELEQAGNPANEKGKIKAKLTTGECFDVK